MDGVGDVVEPTALERAMGRAALLCLAASTLLAAGLLLVRRECNAYCGVPVRSISGVTALLDHLHDWDEPPPGSRLLEAYCDLRWLQKHKHVEAAIWIPKVHVKAFAAEMGSDSAEIPRWGLRHLSFEARSHLATAMVAGDHPTYWWRELHTDPDGNGVLFVVQL